MADRAVGSGTFDRIERIARRVMAPDVTRAILHSVSEARRLAVKLRSARRLVQAEKADRTIVTAADLAVQALLLRALMCDESGIPVVAEEDFAVLRETAGAALRRQVEEILASARTRADLHELGTDGQRLGVPLMDYWTLDPIDGTRGFLRGDHFVVALARIRHGVPIFAALACPTLVWPPSGPARVAPGDGPLVVAIRGGGTWVLSDDGGTERVSRDARLAPPHAFRICGSVEAAHVDDHALSRVASRARAASEIIRVDSQLKYVLVAAGAVDAYLRIPPRDASADAVWDHAPGTLIALEAGALVTDLDGQPLDYAAGGRLTHNRGVVCGTPRAHARLLQAIEQVAPGPPGHLAS